MSYKFIDKQAAQTCQRCAQMNTFRIQLLCPVPLWWFYYQHGTALASHAKLSPKSTQDIILDLD